jgi:hypothetical protein
LPSVKKAEPERDAGSRHDPECCSLFVIVGTDSQSQR